MTVVRNRTLTVPVNVSPAFPPLLAPENEPFPAFRRDGGRVLKMCQGRTSRLRGRDDVFCKVNSLEKQVNGFICAGRKLNKFSVAAISKRVRTLTFGKLCAAF